VPSKHIVNSGDSSKKLRRLLQVFIFLITFLTIYPVRKNEPMKLNLRSRGLTRGEGNGGTNPRAPNHYGFPDHCEERTITAGVPKSPNNVNSTFFSAVHLLRKVHWFEHGGTKLAFRHERHITSLRPWCVVTGRDIYVLHMISSKTLGRICSFN